jgi:two-component system alkaline phosphatase synthesis response regulator PhoP
MKARVLIVEDEATLARVLLDNMLAEGHEAVIAVDGQQALELWQADPPDLVILDVMLPGINGFDLCRQMRAAGDTTPVLFLSARGQPEDRVQGLRAGGDDYLVKPFNLHEFLLRTANMLKRRSWGLAGTESFVLSFGGNRIDFRTWIAQLHDGTQELLGEREIAILRLLWQRQQEVVSRDEILDAVWGDDAYPSSRTVDNFILRFRRLFEPDGNRPLYFHTVWGVGYRFTPSGLSGNAR